MVSLSAWPEVAALLSSKNKGLQILDDEQNVLHHIQGQFGRFDYRIGSERLLIAASNVQQQQIQLMSMNLKIKHGTNLALFQSVHLSLKMFAYIPMLKG
jgi:3-phytase